MLQQSQQLNLIHCQRCHITAFVAFSFVRLFGVVWTLSFATSCRCRCRCIWRTLWLSKRGSGL